MAGKVDKNMVVTAFPTLNPGLLIKGNGPSLHAGITEAYGQEGVEFFYFGRVAVWHAVKMLGLRQDEYVLMPSYHCSVEVEAAVQAGVGVRFYKVDGNMDADLDDMEEKICRNTKAVFVIHYFGFPQRIFEIEGLCKSRGLYLMEDCAHALLSSCEGRYLGTIGDFGVLSMQKFLPVPNGGVLLMNNEALRRSFASIPPNRRSVARTLLLSVLRNLEANKERTYEVVRLCLLNPLRALLRVLKGGSDLGIVNVASVDFNVGMVNLGMSEISRKILERIDVGNMVAIRRENYEYLLGLISPQPNVRICFPELYQGVCPYFMAVEVQDNRDVHGRLKERGVSSFIFGEFLHERLPETGFDEARGLSRKIIALPIHQDLGRRELEYVAQALRCATEEPGGQGSGVGGQAPHPRPNE
jgi:dTDP-4-amino-4,6-dideoxygalactose transaminase